jgi:CheY-like chemotaxis protein
MMGGRRKIDSAPGQGTRSSIFMPVETKVLVSEVAPVAVAATVPRVAHAKGNGATLGSQRKIRIMLVDDHALVRNAIARALQGAPDMEIAGEAPDGLAAVELVRKIVPDIVLMDIGMPRMDGIEATRLIHQELPDVSIIGLSMFEESEQSAAMRKAGACAYMTKNGDFEALTAAIRNWGSPALSSR